MINGKTRLLGLIGNPVEHTLSPVIHNNIAVLLEEKGIKADTVYVPFHVENGYIEDAVKGAYALNVLGMNVTVPYKQDVIGCLAEIDKMAEQIGAVNTLVRCEGGYKGYNTDAIGIKRELEFYNVNIKGSKVVMLGAGGASRAVAYAVADMGPEEIIIFNRTLNKAQTIADDVNKYFGRTFVCAKTFDEIDSIYDESMRGFVAIQCTSVGLSPNDSDCIVTDGRFYEYAGVGVDLVYKPCETRFMKNMMSAGKRAYNGLRMLLYQGIAAYELFNDIKIDEAVVEITARRLERAADICRPIVLVGYMGSGKSTIAREISKRTGISVIDTDAYIEREQGRKISQIFETDGEQAFRDMETNLLKQLVLRGGTFILSVGGGMPLREENRELLKTIGTVVYLKAKPETLYHRVKNDTSRPLLKGGDLRDKITNMLTERNPIYEEAAGTIVCTDNLQMVQTVQKVMSLMELAESK